jgi:hypothetical protein
MRSTAIVLLVLLLLFCVEQAQRRMIHAPGDSSTIHGGVNGAVNGDTVLVAPGAYYEHINFSGRAILVKGEGGGRARS